MQIALDYDGTYTEDPEFWEEVKSLADFFGHSIFFVTKRGPNNKGEIPVGDWQVHYCDRKAKVEYCKLKDIEVNVWIDDDPVNLFKDG